MAQILEALEILRLVHQDIQPSNICILMNLEQLHISDLQLIDFGSSYKFDEGPQLLDRASEYLPPEILIHIDTITRFPGRIKKATE